MDGYVLNRPVATQSMTCNTKDKCTMPASNSRISHCIPRHALPCWCNLWYSPLGLTRCESLPSLWVSNWYSFVRLPAYPELCPRLVVLRGQTRLIGIIFKLGLLYFTFVTAWVSSPIDIQKSNPLTDPNPAGCTLSAPSCSSSGRRRKS